MSCYYTLGLNESADWRFVCRLGTGIRCFLYTCLLMSLGALIYVDTALRLGPKGARFDNGI